VSAVLDGSSEIGDADLGFAQPGVATGSSTSGQLDVLVRRVVCEVWLGDLDSGTQLSDVLGARCTFGWDQGASTAEVTFSDLPSGVSQGSKISIRMGATWRSDGGDTHNVRRFVGYVREIDESGYPHSVVLHCKGSLYLLEEYENTLDNAFDDVGRPGYDFDTLVGTSSGATLRSIVTHVLDIVGVTYSLTNLDNPPHIYGDFAPEEFTWGTHQSALDFLHTVFEASTGERLFNSSDGTLYLASITGRPRSTNDLGLSADDVLATNASSNRNISGLRDQVVAEGYDDGAGPFTAIKGSGARSHRVTSSLIESDAFAGEIAQYWLDELNRELRKISIATWRDDVVGPAQTHLLADDLLARLGISGQFWVLTVTLEVANAAYTANLSYVGGGPAANYSPPQV
jgi:hypothetical protein